jgi:hypothetical protein
MSMLHPQINNTIDTFRREMEAFLEKITPSTPQHEVQRELDAITLRAYRKALQLMSDNVGTEGNNAPYSAWCWLYLDQIPRQQADYKPGR